MAQRGPSRLLPLAAGSDRVSVATIVDLPRACRRAVAKRVARAALVDREVRVARAAALRPAHKVRDVAKRASGVRSIRKR